jgi:hypothetical protein
MQVTRRDLVAGLAAVPLASATNAQPPSLPQDKLQKAYADVQEIGLKLRQVSVPIALEPAFVFEP